MSRSTSSSRRPQRGVRVAFTRKGYNRLTRAGILVRMAKKSDTIGVIVYGILCLALLAFLASILFASPASAHAGIGVVGPKGEKQVVETPSKAPEETLKRVLLAVLHANESDLPALLVAMEPVLDHALVEDMVNWDAYLVLHAAKQIDGCLEIEGNQRVLWQGPLYLFDKVGPKSVENPGGWDKKIIVETFETMILLERHYRRCWMRNLRPAPDPAPDPFTPSPAQE